MPSPRPMQLLTAPRLTPLVEHLAANMRGAPLPPRKMEIIVVQSQGMRRWLTLQLADEFGCAGSISLPFPAHFVREIGRRIAPATAVSADGDPFSRETLAWRLDSLLRSLPSDDAVYEPLRHYIAGTDERARFGLATRIAARLDDYQMYRADLLREWEVGRDVPDTPHAAWQAALWRTLCGNAAGGAPHLAARLRRTIDALNAESVPDLPSRVTVFGVSTLPPLFIELLAALARHVPVTVYTASLNHASVHPLAAALGTQGREFVAELIGRGAEVTSLEEQTTPRTGLLGSLQRELGAGGAGDSPVLLADGDASLRIHDAHGRQRQLEVLRDQLFAALSEDPTLRPHDLLLLVPDAAEWAPLVDAVFGASDKDAAHLPYRIADRPMRRAQPAAEALSRLLALEGGRLARSEVFGLLAHPLVRQAAGLSEAEVDALEVLTQRANVRWGYDASSRAALGLPGYEAASWRAGLDRLLLGLTIGRSDDEVLGLLAESGDTAGEPVMVAALAAWVDTLAATLADWRTPRTLAAWSNTLIGVADAFLHAEEPAEQQTLLSVTSAIRRLGVFGETAAHSAEVTFGVVRDWLESELDNDSFGGGFLAGGMTVAALKPMRSLPFRVIAVAGLDDGVFPRQERRSAFDLLELERRAGDRNLRDDDRQLFLDLLLAAQDRLILAYGGRAVSDNSPRAPSVVLDELLDHLDRRTGGEARRQLVVSHPLQPFSPRYFIPGRDPRLFTFSRAQASAARVSAQRGEADRPFVTAAHALPPEATGTTLELTLRDLTDCWTNPSKFFCKHALRLTLRDDERDVDDEEIFTPGKMEQGGIKARMLAAAMSGERDEGRERRRLLADGTLPPGELGVSWHSTLSEQVANVLAQLDGDAHPVTVPITLGGNGWRLTGRIDGVRGDRRITVRAGGVRPEHRIRAWVEHVAMCAAREGGTAGLPGTTVLVGKDGLDETIGTVANAASLLNALVGVVREAKSSPLPFFAQSGWKWFEASRSKPKKKKGGAKDDADGSEQAARRKQAATSEFERMSNQWNKVPCDAEDAHVALCFRGANPMVDRWAEFDRLATTLFNGWLSAGATQ
jgi:exodeoxyribonuclease V gamma subunit